MQGGTLEMLHEVETRRMGRPPMTENQRALILQCAANIFSKKGFDGTSISDLSAAVGMSKPAIYHYFANKREICDSIIHDALNRLVLITRKEVAGASDPMGQLKLFMMSHAGQYETNLSGLITMLSSFEGMEDGPMKRDSISLRDAHEASLRKILSDGIQKGVFKVADVAMASRGILSMLNWLARWYKPEGRVPAREIAVQYFEMICAGLIKRS